MVNYNSQYTGAEVDAAIGKVNNLHATDVKTDATHTVQDDIDRIDGEINRIEGKFDLEFDGLTDDVADLESGKLDASKNAVATVGGLVTPSVAPSVVEIVGIDSTGAQVRIQIDTNDFEIDGTTSPYILKKKAEAIPHNLLVSNTFKCTNYGGSYIATQIRANNETCYVTRSGAATNIPKTFSNINEFTVEFYNNYQPVIKVVSGQVKLPNNTTIPIGEEHIFQENTVLKLESDAEIQIGWLNEG